MALGCADSGIGSRPGAWFPRLAVGAALLLALQVLPAQAANNTSQGGGYWTNAAVWSDGVPTADDDVVIAAGHTMTLTGINPISINSLSITGTLTHAANGSAEAHNVRLQIAGDLTIAAAGRIDVTGKGYSSGGAGDGRYGGSHGGRGGMGYASTYVAGTYDSLTNPVNCGKPGNGPSGGGVVVLNVAGAATIDGSILAKGSSGSGTYGGGAGGSINITANSISGSGTNSVAGGDGDNGGGGGGGGRISVVTAGSDFGGLVFSAKAGQGWNTTARPGGVEDAAKHGAGGTIFLKKSGDVSGSLLVDWEGRQPTTSATTTIFTNATHQFDAIITTNKGVFVVGSNAVLDLTGCTLRSDSTTNSITSRLIVGTPTSTIIWPAAWTNQGTISWTGTNVMSATSDVTIASGGILTHEAGQANRINLDLAGTLDVQSGGAIYVKGMGYPSGQGIGLGGGRAGGGHGGEGGIDYQSYPPSGTYDSITNPVLPGSATTYLNGGPGQGGGVVLVRATGTVTVNGTINASGAVGGGGGGGGTVNIRAQSMAGSGSITANGGTNANAESAAGGGGRVAVALSGSATFGSVTMTVAAGATTRAGGAGTIYLKGNNAAYGKLVIPATASSVRTLIGPAVTDAVVGDVELQNNAKLAISNNCRLTVYGSWTNAGATNAISGGTVEFAGTDAVNVWGGNTWSNLTIAAAGKTVSFECGKTQTVYGVPAFSNVTLQSTVSGTSWKLFKPSWGNTQAVGVVTIKDSDAMVNTGATFQAAIGSIDLGNNANWQFPCAISNQPASDVAFTSATFNGHLISACRPDTSVCVLWGTSDGGANWNSWANTNWWSPGAWTNNTYPATNITGLAANTTYYYTFGATNAGGSVVASPTVSFTTAEWDGPVFMAE